VGSAVIEPALVRHADWSVDAAKRWVATAVRVNDRYLVRSVEPEAGQVLLPADDAGALVGVDFPIGLPLAYAAATGIDSFTAALGSLGGALLPRFFDVAATPAEVGLGRPFYPARAGPRGTATRRHLTDGLGIAFADLWRICERPFPGRPAAGTLFWLVGSQQVGRAALHGWRSVLQPARRPGGGVALWPFDGELADLVARHPVTLAEAYPAEAARQFGFARGAWSKRRQPDRRRVGLALLDWAAEHDVGWAADVEARVLDGFGPAPSGEDPFDAAVGLLGLLRVARGVQPAGPAALPAAAKTVEGWILGQDVVP
jgi:hypothetical protein